MAQRTLAYVGSRTTRERNARGREAGGTGALALQVHLSWAHEEAEAEAIALDQWRSNVFSEPVAWDLDTPEAFDVVSEQVGIDQVRSVVNVSETPYWRDISVTL